MDHVTAEMVYENFKELPANERAKFLRCWLSLASSVKTFLMRKSSDIWLAASFRLPKLPNT